LPNLIVDGYDVETWTTIAYQGLVYIPNRWANWEVGKIRPGVSLTILDPAKKKVVAVASDDRCTSGGRPVFDTDGTLYVMGDGRTYSAQMYANAAGKPAPKNCFLRIKPGQTTFDKDFYVEVMSVTDGLESISELNTAQQGSGVAFANMFYEDMLPDGVKPVDFDFWGEPVFKLWTIQLGDQITAKPVNGATFSSLGFDEVAADGKLYSGQSTNAGATTVIYEVDPTTATSTRKFEMVGNFYGLYPLE
jgi:hypothetical protein